ncbi:hypothetical protein QBC41DRAFT_127431 [Cercophora samala]|uniref:Uncharacterized protein n=1 Tax=Cercophora samala TaxID=330535 RepID=A0AA39ZBV6_9PEZI|nr:hypothetical protein QBC41DRAFT_127431 [Cercophora samala]
MNEVAWCYLEGFGTKKDKVSGFCLTFSAVTFFDRLYARIWRSSRFGLSVTMPAGQSNGSAFSLCTFRSVDK